MFETQIPVEPGGVVLLDHETPGIGHPQSLPQALHQKPDLLGMGSDYEQATRHRVPPASTPVLDGPNGKPMP